MSIVSSLPPKGRPPTKATAGPGTRSHTDRVRAELEERAKLAFRRRRAAEAGVAALEGKDGVDGNVAAALGGGMEERTRPSDEVEGMRVDVKWEPVPNALNTPIAQDDAVLPPGTLAVVSIFCEV